MATIASAIANSQGGKTTLKDFMPEFKPRQKQTSNEQMGQQLSALFGNRKRRSQ